MPEIIFSVECLPEDISPEDNASAIDDETDAEILAWINAELESGNEWAWCQVRVVARYGAFEGTDYLGGCSYRSEEDFKAGGYYEDMKAQALIALEENIRLALASLRGFSAALKRAGGMAHA